MVPGLAGSHALLTSRQRGGADISPFPCEGLMTGSTCLIAAG